MHQKPFSKLKKPLEALFVPELKIQFNCNSFPIRGQWGHHNSVPRYYLVLGKEIIWDFPANFEIKELHFGWWASFNNISALIREYIDTPIDELLTKEFENETLKIDTNYLPPFNEPIYKINYHLTELFIAADRRIGKEKLKAFAASKNNPVVDKILNKRFTI